MSDALMRVVVQAAAFFELCEDDVLDPDVAVKQLEWISWELQRLDPEATDALVAFVHAEAETTTDPRYRAFLWGSQRHSACGTRSKPAHGTAPRH